MVWMPEGVEGVWGVWRLVMRLADMTRWRGVTGTFTSTSLKREVLGVTGVYGVVARVVVHDASSVISEQLVSSVALSNSTATSLIGSKFSSLIMAARLMRFDRFVGGSGSTRGKEWSV